MNRTETKKLRKQFCKKYNIRYTEDIDELFYSLRDCYPEELIELIGA